MSIRHGCRAVALCAPASNGTPPAPWALRGLAGLSTRLESGPNLFGLLKILFAGAPENHAAGHAPDGDRDPELGGDALDTALHRGGLACAVGNRQAHGLI